MKMKTSTRYVSDYVYEAANENGNKVRIDMQAPDEKQGMSPMEMVLSALSGCAVVEVVLMLKKKRKQVIDISVETEGERNEDHPKKFISLHSHYTLISPDTSTEDLEKVVRLALEKYCSVASSLNVPVTFSTTIKSA